GDHARLLRAVQHTGGGRVAGRRPPSDAGVVRMSELRELYQEVILDHNRRPRNFGPLPEANHQAEGYNPLCGDKVTVFLDLEDGRIRDVSFQGAGCAISTAS